MHQCIHFISSFFLNAIYSYSSYIHSLIHYSTSSSPPLTLNTNAQSIKNAKKKKTKGQKTRVNASNKRISKY